MYQATLTAVSDPLPDFSVNPVPGVMLATLGHPAGAAPGWTVSRISDDAETAVVATVTAVVPLSVTRPPVTPAGTVNGGEPW
jgi:hypothetical protein